MTADCRARTSAAMLRLHASCLLPSLRSALTALAAMLVLLAAPGAYAHWVPAAGARAHAEATTTAPRGAASAAVVLRTSVGPPHGASDGTGLAATAAESPDVAAGDCGCHDRDDGVCGDECGECEDCTLCDAEHGTHVHTLGLAAQTDAMPHAPRRRSVASGATGAVPDGAEPAPFVPPRA